jgi:poly(3-hydroxybutyrate) depolymerase
VSDKPAGHAMVVEAAKNPCGVTAPPFINDCDYDAAGSLLAHLLGPLNAAAAKAGGRLVSFDQKAFAGGDAAAISLEDAGYLYVPKACESAGCRVHVAFHGCRQGSGSVGEAFVQGAGYQRWADTNKLLLLFPQAKARDGWSLSSWTFVWNPNGCWDWWGYTGAAYATKQGAQIRAVKAMLERLAAARGT